MKPSFKIKGKYAAWTHLGKDKLNTIYVTANREVVLQEVVLDPVNSVYMDLDDVPGIPAIRYAEEHIGNNFMEIAIEAMK